MTKGKVTIVMLSVALAFAVGILVSLLARSDEVQTKSQQWEYALLLNLENRENNTSQWMFRSSRLNTDLEDSYQDLIGELRKEGACGQYAWETLYLFNQVGSLGWEFVGVRVHENEIFRFTRYYFKRPVSD
jgi:hypothetical protein